MKKQQEIPCGEKYLVLLIQWSVSFMLLVMTWLFWEHCSPKWLKPLCSPPVQCQSSCARGRRARLCCEHQQGFGGTEPSWAAACGALGDFPHPSARLEIPPVVFGSSVPLAAAVSLCFAPDPSSDQPAQALLPVFGPSCKSCLLYLHPGFLTLPLASQHDFYSPFGSLALGFLAQNVIIPV